jgi:cytochrome c peroxidase
MFLFFRSKTMNKLSIIIVSIFLYSCDVSSNYSPDENLNNKLDSVILLYDLSPIDTKPIEITNKYILGRSLFFDKILSGNRDVSCSTCHLMEFGSSDGLPLSIGEGGTGAGNLREPTNTRALHKKNSLDLWNRDHNDVTNMFWDGRISTTNLNSARFKTPLGENLPVGLDNLMAVQTLFPLIAPEEMLGYPDDYSSQSLPDEHALMVNELANIYEPSNSPLLHANQIYDAIMIRLLGDNENLENWHNIYRSLFTDAYQNTNVSEFNIAHVANALSHFIEITFATRGSNWDQYLNGKVNALTENAKKGALLFYGKGRCSVCHTGQTFSDYDFHSIGVLDEDDRIFSGFRDLGRFSVTGVEDDRFKFRTPPLRNILNTPPYFHNGSALEIGEAIYQHISPLRNSNRYHESGRFLMTNEQTNNVSSIIRNKLLLDEADVNHLIQFLDSLSYFIPDEQLELFIPDNVPSGLIFDF